MLPSMRPHARAAAAILVAIASLAACGHGPASPPPASPSSAATAAAPSGPSPSPAAPSDAPSPSAAVGFAFDPESIVGYFQSIGFTCADRQPSSTAVGYEFESCQVVDPDGRTRTIGVVTDPADNVADAFLRVRGAEAETVLDPSTVLEPFARFLGAFLGEAQGNAVLPWLADHLGDADARTTLGDLTIAAYTPAPDDHTKLTVEIATKAYLAAPAPSLAAQ